MARLLEAELQFRLAEVVWRLGWGFDNLIDAPFLLTAYLLWGFQPGPLEHKVSVFKRWGTVEGVVGQVIVGVEDTKLRGGQHVLVPGLE